MARVTKAEQSIIDAAMKRLDKCIKAEESNRKAAIDDLKFASGESQWDAGEKKRRSDKGRPALQFNLLPKFVDQVVGDMLHNSPSIKVQPVDSKADINIAKIRQGIISNVEYLSNSKGIYGYAGRQMVTCGYGAWRVLTRYTEENPFLQEAYLESVRNPFLMYLDPASKDQNYADARYGFVLEKMALAEFKDRYPKALFPSKELKTGDGLGQEHWFDGETVTVAEYFTVETETVTMLQLEDGQVVDEDKFKEIKDRWNEKNDLIINKLAAGPMAAPPQQAPSMPPQAGMAPPPVNQQGVLGQPQGVGAAVLPMAPQGAGGMMPPVGQPPAPQGINNLAADLDKLGAEPRVAKRRDTEKTVIKHRILTCCEILEGGAEGKRFPGKFVPLVMVKGKELNIEGKNHVYSLIRHAKDAQKMFNYWNSAAAETIALAPKTPWLGTAKQFEGYENDYAAANVENFPFLKYNVDPEAPGAPQRVPVGQPPAAIFQMISQGENNIKSAIGLFNADLGAPGSEQTGAAIMARQRPGDIGTFEFSENMARAVLYTGKILNSIIPEIYDSERDVRLRNIDDTDTFVPINTTVGSAAKALQKSPDMYRGLDPAKIQKMLMEDGKEAKFNDVTVGKYDIVVTTGPSYATQRQESAMYLMQLAQSMPQQMAIASDLIVKNLDFKDADELSDRLRKTLPPNIIKPKPGEQLPPPQPSPAMIQAQSKMAESQAKQQMAQLKLQMEQLRLEEQKLKLQIEKAKAQAELGQDPTKIADLQMERERLDLEKARFAHQRQKDTVEYRHRQGQDYRKHDHDMRKLDIEEGKVYSGGD